MPMARQLRVLDLFSGTGSFSRAFAEHGHDVTTVNDECVEWDDELVCPDIQGDIMQMTADDFDRPDVILASPPCKKFSVASLRWYWDKLDDGTRVPVRDDEEKAQKAMDALRLVHHTLDLIDALEPRYWFMENPAGAMRPVLSQHEIFGDDAAAMIRRNDGIDPTGTVTWCQYWTERDDEERGYPVMKRTHLWGDHPDTMEYLSCSNGDDCHQSAPRGSQAGTQGKDGDDIRGAIPYGLSDAIRQSVEEAML